MENKLGEGSQRTSRTLNKGITTLMLHNYQAKLLILFIHFRYRKSFAQLLEEEQNNRPEPPNYVSAQIPPSKFPERRFCAVCGFSCSYTCLSCGARYCSVKCLGTHQDTRCLKWTAWFIFLSRLKFCVIFLIHFICPLQYNEKCVLQIIFQELWFIPFGNGYITLGKPVSGGL